jgi:hypothetical protein
VDNAETMLALDREFGGFRKYLRSFPDFDTLQQDLVKRFKFLGSTGAYFFLHVVREDVPPHDEWTARYGSKMVPRRPRGRKKPAKA